MSYIVTHPHSNAQIPLPHPGKDFLFCAHGRDLSQRIERARKNLVLDDSPRRNASFARSLAQVLRRKHEHTARCSACLLHEVFAESPVSQ
jgi:hypothetical protein